MKEIASSELIREEIPIVKKIIKDEVWYESERRGYSVSEDDIKVQKRVAEIVMENGLNISNEAMNRLKEKKGE